MLTPAQKQEIVKEWQASAERIHRVASENGYGPHEMALIHATSIRGGIERGLTQENFAFQTIPPAAVAEALEAGEFDQEIAAILGYV